MKKVLVPIFTLTILLSGYSQDRKQALEFFQTGNFEQAIDEYKAILEEDENDIEANYNIAVSYLNTNIDKSLAIPHLELLVENPKIDPNTWYLLGRAYHFGYQFDKAIEAFHKFMEDDKGSLENRDDVEKQIEYCENAKEIMKFPVRVTFENLGKNVNSAYADYFPFVPADESYLIFNSKRDQNSEELTDGSYSPKIFLSHVKEGEYQKAQILPAEINGVDGKQEIVGLNGEGSRAIFYLEDFKQAGDLYECKINGATLKMPTKLGKTINTKYTEIAGCITNDDQKLYFASDRPGGYGGIDIYSCQLLPNGKWSEPRNLGPTINTAYDEDFPNISPDGTTLYFSSKGHTSMGGYDIFKVVYDKRKHKFSKVQNMGYPINTPEDNMNFRASENGEFGYISAVRSGGYGDLDIYRVRFEEVEPRYTIITGNIVAKDGAKKFEDVFIQVTDQETDEIYGDYVPNEKTLRYVIILPPGKYDMFVGAYGYEEIYEEIEILDKSSFKAHLSKDINLVPAK